jgi:hypothetical protein
MKTVHIKRYVNNNIRKVLDLKTFIATAEKKLHIHSLEDWYNIPKVHLDLVPNSRGLREQYHYLIRVTLTINNLKLYCNNLKVLPLRTHYTYRKPIFVHILQKKRNILRFTECRILLMFVFAQYSL